MPEDERKINAIPIFRRGKKEDSDNYRLISLTSIPGKVMEKLINLSLALPLGISRIRGSLGAVSMASPRGSRA